MSDFKFKLQAVLQLRERERDDASQAVHQAQLALRKLEQQIGTLRDQYTAQQPLQVASSNEQVDPQKLIESQRFQMQLLQDIQGLNLDKERINAELKSRQSVLIEREQQVRSIEKLQERQLTQFQLTEARKEQVALDQWAGFQYWKSANPDNSRKPKSRAGLRET